MALLTATEVRQHIETDLGDTALDRLINDADLEIIDRLGAVASQTEVFKEPSNKHIILARKASSISSVVERIIDTDYTLAASDYTLMGDGYTVERLQGSGYPNNIWQGIVTIVYVPPDETASRKRLLVDLVKLTLAYDGRLSSGIGDVRVQGFSDYQAQRNALFDALQSRGRRMRLA